MKDRFETTKRVNAQLVKAGGRVKWLVLLLILQGVIWWIFCKPGLFPFLQEPITSVREFLIGFLLPHDSFDTESYRHYIGLLCDWVTGLPFYPFLAKVVPLIVPVWLAVTVLQILFLKLRLSSLKKPRKEPKAAKPPRKKEKGEQTAAQSLAQALRPKATDSGLLIKNRTEAEQRLQKLQASCNVRRYQDRGIWFSNFCKVRGKQPPDQIKHWEEDGSIVLEGAYTVRFELINGTAYLVGSGNKIQMKKGVPFVLKRDNEANESIAYCAAIWLGGIQND